MSQKLSGEILCYRAHIQCAVPEACSVPIYVGKQVNSPTADSPTPIFSGRFWSKGEAFQVELQRGKNPPLWSVKLYGKQSVGSANAFLVTKALTAQEKLQ